MTSAPWSLFELRLRTGSLVLRLPGVDDLSALIELAKAGIHPPEEMPFGFAWTDQWSPRARPKLLPVPTAVGVVAAGRVEPAARRLGRCLLAPRGVARETQRFRLSREDWRARERPEVGVEGLEPCIELFGLPPRE